MFSFELSVFNWCYEMRYFRYLAWRGVKCRALLTVASNLVFHRKPSAFFSDGATHGAVAFPKINDVWGLFRRSDLISQPEWFMLEHFREIFHSPRLVSRIWHKLGLKACGESSQSCPVIENVLQSAKTWWSNVLEIRTKMASRRRGPDGAIDKLATK